MKRYCFLFFTVLTLGCGGSSSPAPKPPGWQPETGSSAATGATKPEGWKPESTTATGSTTKP
jgi:hypothetical protein